MLAATIAIHSADVYVSPSGSDANDGTAGAPKATLTSALRQAREMRRLNAPGVDKGVTIHMADGVYDLYEPVFVRPEDSGTPSSPTVITSEGAPASAEVSESTVGKSMANSLWPKSPTSTAVPSTSASCGSTDVKPSVPVT